jgi:acetylornithine/succinyldiaminopimelate/putrescine aminotransferase
VKEDFLKYQAQTSTTPFILEVERAEGSYLYDKTGKAYLDFVAGVSANTLGHNPHQVVKAVKKQLDAYAHVMVYGEFVQEPQVKLAKMLADTLPDSLNCTYFTNSGTEAIEGAMKLAKRATGRMEIISAVNAYHGNTQGAMSACGNEAHIAAFRPLIPSVRSIRFNAIEDIELITDRTAAVLLETIQGGAGFIVPDPGYLDAVRARCEQTGTLLILDEIQSGIGRTGKLFGYEHFQVVPDILVTGKGLGGGMPIGAFISDRSLMQLLTEKPKLGHITTFGGHPVNTAAALATLTTLLEKGIMESIPAKERQFRDALVHEYVSEIRGKGLMLALIMQSPVQASELILKCKEKGLLLYWLLYEDCAVRITPPLTITDDEIRTGCRIIMETLEEIP